jgi:hypothetical protein
MKTHALLALVGLATGFIMPAFTQTTIPKELVGTWTIVSITQEKDGKTTDLFGPNPQGRRIIDADGHVFFIATRGDLPKFASNNRAAGTPEENKAVVQGSISFFGTVTANGQTRPIPNTSRFAPTRIGSVSSANPLTPSMGMNS